MTNFFDPIISPHFEHIGISIDSIGFLFGTLAISYSIFSPFITFIANKVPVRYITFATFGLVTLGSFLMGPSSLLGEELDNEKQLTIAGFLILGVASASVSVPLLSEIIDAV